MSGRILRFFRDLLDVDESGQAAGKVVAVAADGETLEFVDAAAGGASALVDLTDVTGTPGTGKAPVSDGAGGFPLTDVATQAELNALAATAAAADTAAIATAEAYSDAALAAHAAASDPHTGYQKESEKGQANGYASLDGSALVPDAQIPSSIARDSEVTAAVSAEATARDAAIAAALAAADGAGLSDNGSGVLAVNVDGSTIEINADTLRVKADGITSSHIAANAVGSSELADDAVDTNAIQNGAVTSAKIADGTVSAGDLAYAPGAGFYGDGSDGTVTFDGSSTVLGLTPSASVYTLARDVFLAAGTINNGVVIVTNGFRIFCAGTLTNNGTIRWNGNNAGTGVNNQNGGGALGNSVGSINAQSPGSNSSSTGGGNGPTGAGNNGVNTGSKSYGGRGGSGGTGASGAGGAGGTIPASSTVDGAMRSLFAAYGNLLSNSSGVITYVRTIGGTGGGSGAGDGTNNGAGGGGGGGTVLIYARVFAGTGSIEAKGGNGASPTAGNCGGGGGGGGGFIVVVSQSVVAGAISGQTISVAGGAKGSPSGTGLNNAADGSPGTIILLAN